MNVRTGILLLGLALAAACGTNPSNPDAANDPPANCLVIDASACNMPMPSYANDVAPVLDQACNSTCHAAGVGPWPLDNYDDVSDWAPIIAGDVSTCRMPPEDAGAGNGLLTAAQRTMILDWVACGSPNN
jgi:hypothetical protein